MVNSYLRIQYYIHLGAKCLIKTPQKFLITWLDKNRRIFTEGHNLNFNISLLNSTLSEPNVINLKSLTIYHIHRWKSHLLKKVI